MLAGPGGPHSDSCLAGSHSTSPEQVLCAFSPHLVSQIWPRVTFPLPGSQARFVPTPRPGPGMQPSLDWSGGMRMTAELAWHPHLFQVFAAGGTGPHNQQRAEHLLSCLEGAWPPLLWDPSTWDSENGPTHQPSCLASPESARPWPSLCPHCPSPTQVSSLPPCPSTQPPS